MRILKVYPYPDVRAGTEITMHVGSAVLRRMGHQVFIVHGQETTPETAREYDGEIGLPSLFDRNSKIRPFAFGREMAMLDRYIAEHQIDVLHMHTYPRTEAIADWTHRYPVVIGIHVPLCPTGVRYLWADRCVCERDIGIGCLTVGYRKKDCGHLANGVPIALPGFVRGMLENHLLRQEMSKAARIITNSHWMIERVVKDGLPKDRIRLLRSPIEMTGGEDDYRDRLESPPAVLFVGRMVDFKGPDHLLLASREISVPHRIWFIGDGPFRGRCETLATELGIADRATFFGEMKHNEVDEIRRRSNVIVLPSLWPEPFSRVAPEAAMIQRPVVGYGTGGTSEQIVDGETGFVVEPGDYRAMAVALEKILTQPELGRQMGRTARERCRQLVPERHGEILAGIYQEAIETGPWKA